MSPLYAVAMQSTMSNIGEPHWLLGGESLPSGVWVGFHVEIEFCANFKLSAKPKLNLNKTVSKLLCISVWFQLCGKF